MFCSLQVTLNASFTLSDCYLLTTLKSTGEPSPAPNAAQQSSHVDSSPFLFGLLPDCHLPVLGLDSPWVCA